MALIGGGSSLGGLEGSSNVSRLLVVLSGDSAPLTAALAKAEGSLAGFSANAGTIGRALTRTLSLPFLALSGIAIKLAADFDTAIGRVAGLTPILQQTGDSVDQLKAKLLAIAQDPKIIATPTDLANSLYFAGSAGLSAAQAFDVVKASAEGASAGMGDTTDITKVLIAALNNYRSTGLTTARAMDILTESIKQGTAAPEDMAVALGRLLPVARAAGVSFEQVTASVAQLTNLGVPTRVATTGLRALFSELLAPTAAATKNLDAFGISAKQLRDTLSTGGPIAAFALLKDAVQGNVEALHSIIPQIRGFTSYLGLTGDNAKSFKEILDAVTHSTGSFQKALDIISKTPQFQFQKSLQELQIAGISVGEKLIPVFVHLAHALETIANIVSNMPGPVQVAFAAFLVAGAAVGPILQIYAAMAELNAVVRSGASLMTNFGTVAKGAVVGLASIGISAAIAIGSFQSMVHNGASVVSILGTLIGTFAAVALAIKGLQTVALTGALGSGVLSEALVALGGSAIPVAAGLAALVTVIGLVSSAAHKAQRDAAQMGDAMQQGASGAEVLATSLKNIKDSGIRDELTNIAHSMGLLGTATAQAIPQLQSGIGTKLIAQFQALAKGSEEFRRLLDLSGGTANFAKALQDAVAKSGDLGNNLHKAGLDGHDLFDALATLAAEDPGFAKQSTDIKNLLLQYGNLGSAFKDFALQTAGQIALHQQEGVSVKALADQYGISVPFMQQQLDKFGVTATGVLAGSTKAFYTAAFGIDKAANATAAHLAQITDATIKAADALQSSISSSFDLFGTLPKKLAPIDQIITKVQELGRVAVAEGANVKSLLEKGVPIGLIQQFVSQGPAMVSAFANATTPQLRKVINAYELGLGAIDAKILEEAAHQETKGHNMVQNFATAIIGAQNLTRNAGIHIIDSVAAGLGTGKLKPQALSLITQFVNTLNSQQGITKKAGSDAAQNFAEGIASGDYTGPKGKLLVQKAADGIAANTDLTNAQAKKLVHQVADAMTSSSHEVLASGHHVGEMAITGLKAADPTSAGKTFDQHFADGISSNIGLVDNAISALAAHAKALLNQKLQASPVYFTYHYGEQLVTDLAAGLTKQTEQQRFDKFGENLAKSISRGLAADKTIETVLGKLESLITSNLKKAFDKTDVEAVKALQKTGNDLQKELTKIQTAFQNFKQGITQGFAGYKDLFGGVNTLFSDFAQKNADALAQQKSLIDQIAQARADFAQRGIDAAAGGSTVTVQDQLNFDQLIKSLQDQLNALVIPPPTPGPGDISAFLQSQATGARALADGLQKLAAQGLNRALLTQLASQGSSALPIIAALEQSPELIKEFNDAQKIINRVTQKTAEQLGEKFFGKSISEATKALHQFSVDVLKTLKLLVAGLSGGNTDLAKAIQTMIDNLKKIGSGNSNNGGSSNGSGGGSGGAGDNGTNPWDTGWGNGNNVRRAIYNPPVFGRAAGDGVTIAGGEFHFHDVQDVAGLARKLQEIVQKDARSNAGVTGFANKS